MNPGLPQNAPWVPTEALVGPYQTIVSNPRSSRRGKLLRRGARPRLRPATGGSAVPGECVPLPPGCRQIYGWPRCTVDCGPVPKDPRLNNPTPLAWAGIGLGAAALAGGGYYLWRRRAAAELVEQTGVSVDPDCTLFTVTDAEVGPGAADAFVDAAFTALGDAPVSTLVMATTYLDSVAPQCGVTVTEEGVQGVDTWQKAAMVGGLAMVFSGNLHEDGRIDDAVFKQQAEEIQAFLLEHGVDDPAMIEGVFELPPQEGTSQPSGFGAGRIGLYAEPLRRPNLGALGGALIGGVVGALGGMFGGAVGGARAAMPKLVHRSVDFGQDGYLYEKVVVYVPGMPLSLDQYVGVVMAFPATEPVDAQGFPENRATDAVWREAFETEAQALDWVMRFPDVDADYAANPGRAPNMGVVGTALLGLGAAAVGTGGYLWWRNRRLTEACLGARDWLEADGSLSEATEVALAVAMEEAIADGKRNAVDVADAAVVTLSGNPDCRLPTLVWGELLRVRALAIAMAAVIVGAEELLPETEEGPGPAVTGLEVNAACDQVVVHDLAGSEAYFRAWLTDMGFEPGMSWFPNAIQLGVTFLQRVAPHCGVYVSVVGAPEVVGVDTPQKAVMVGMFAVNVTVVLRDMGAVTQEQAAQMDVIVMEWLAAHGVEDMAAMVDEVFVVPGIPDFVPGEGRPSIQPGPGRTLDDWEEPLQNEKVANGSVGGPAGGLWRVYKDNVGDYQGAYYFKVWREGEFAEEGSFQTADEAQEAAVAWILSPPDQGGIGGNPSTRFLLRNNPDFLQLLGAWSATGRGRRLRKRNQPTRGRRALAAVASVLTGRPAAQGLGTVARRTRIGNPNGHSKHVKCWYKCQGTPFTDNCYEKCMGGGGGGPWPTTLGLWGPLPSPEAERPLAGRPGRPKRAKCPKCSDGTPCCWPRSCQPVTQGGFTTCTDRRPRRHPARRMRARGGPTRVRNACKSDNDCGPGTICCKGRLGSSACCLDCTDKGCMIIQMPEPSIPGKPGGGVVRRLGKLARRLRARQVSRPARGTRFIR